METEELKLKLNQLREQYKTSTGSDRKLLKVRGLLLKYALEKREPTPKLI